MSQPLPPPVRPPAGRARRRPAVVAGVALVAAMVALTAAPSSHAPAAATGPRRAASGPRPLLPPTTDPTSPPETEPTTTDPPDPPSTTVPPLPDCTTTFQRPSGLVPPAYVYSPTIFDGTVADPQPDDTFAADAAGHATYVGELRTRTAAGVEQLLVCAHVGTNTPVDTLTPFPLAGPGGHPPTIAPRVQLIDASGAVAAYDLGAPGTSGTLEHYAGSTDPHEGLLRMWVPFTPTLQEPGFTVRVEIRGTPALPGGDTQVMGADEVFIHLGPPPSHRSSRVEQAVGVALRPSVFAGVSQLLLPEAKAKIEHRLSALAPAPLKADWKFTGISFEAAPGVLHSIVPNVSDFAIALENFVPEEGRFALKVSGDAQLAMTLFPRSIGVVEVNGRCDVDSTVSFSARVGLKLDLADNGRRLEPHALFTVTDATVDSVSATGTIVPLIKTCADIEDRIHDGITDELGKAMQVLQDDADVTAEVEKQVGKMLEPGDLAEGPLSSADIRLAGGAGFLLNSPAYVRTGNLGGDVFASEDGVYLAAGVLAYDKGGDRFQYTYVPTQRRTLASETSLDSPTRGRDYDIGLIVSGASVNQLARALTAGGRPAPPVCAETVPPVDPASGDVGLLDLARDVDVDGNGTADVTVAVHPSAAPMYLPIAPAAWPSDGQVRVLVPSLRLTVPIANIGTVAADMRVGVDASIDDFNHLVPTANAVEVSPRFLHIGAGVNQMTDPTADPGGILGIALGQTRDEMTGAVTDMLRPITLPDLSRHIDGAIVHLERLTVETTSSGHLGLFVDFALGAPTSAPPALATTFVGPPHDPPSELTTHLRPTGMPGTGDYVVHWRITDKVACKVLYTSPFSGESSLDKTLPATGLSVITDECTGRNRAFVRVDAVVRRGGQTRRESQTASALWLGPPPSDPPEGCDPNPHPDPDPDPTIPPYCRTKPWLCDTVP